jgi:hypothetical protein
MVLRNDDATLANFPSLKFDISARESLTLPIRIGLGLGIGIGIEIAIEVRKPISPTPTLTLIRILISHLHHVIYLISSRGAIFGHFKRRYSTNYREINVLCRNGERICI